MNKQSKYYLDRNIIKITDVLYFDKNKTISVRDNVRSSTKINKHVAKNIEHVNTEGNNSMDKNININLQNPKENDKLYNLYCQTLNCEKCELAKTRNKVVFGKGNENAGIVFVGEAPGADEDSLGFPFVGRGGRLLDTWFLNASLTLNEIYVMNAIKCRPPNNRDPLESEKTSCRSYFDEQLKIIKPKIICALGKHGFANLIDFDLKDTYSKMRGRVHYHNNIPVIATYHPAFILRNNNFQSKVDEDFKLLLSEYKKL